MDTQNQCWCQLGVRGNVTYVMLLLSSMAWVLKHSDAGSAPLAFHSPTTAAKKRHQASLSHWRGKKSSHQVSPLHHVSNVSVYFYMPSGAGTFGVFCGKDIFSSDFLPEPSSNTCKRLLEWKRKVSHISTESTGDMLGGLVWLFGITFPVCCSGFRFPGDFH